MRSLVEIVSIPSYTNLMTQIHAWSLKTSITSRNKNLYNSAQPLNISFAKQSGSLTISLQRPPAIVLSVNFTRTDV